MNAVEVAKSEMRVFLGSPSQLRDVRAFVEGMITGCPVAGEAVLLASEIAANAIVHTASGKDGTFTVIVVPHAGWVRVEVHDGGSDAEPGVRPPHALEESGNGLYLVEKLATRWGHHGDRHGRVVWFEMDWRDDTV
jgi:anti-sigma regulatory factor (Ser/Thr protein kinase)